MSGKMENVESDSAEFQNYLQVLSLYSKSTGDFSDYGDLSDEVFNSWIYNANLAISKITNDDAVVGFVANNFHFILFPTKQ